LHAEINLRCHGFTLATGGIHLNCAPERLFGARALVHILERQGVRMIAGIPGGAILPFYDALS